LVEVAVGHGRVEGGFDRFGRGGGSLHQPASLSDVA
jgi:hypothetical protein